MDWPSDAALGGESRGPAKLTLREEQVLELIRQGATNKQIADELFISPHTAGVHVSHILAKLGVANRVMAATARVGTSGGTSRTGPAAEDNENA